MFQKITTNFKLVRVKKLHLQNGHNKVKIQKNETVKNIIIVPSEISKI